MNIVMTVVTLAYFGGSNCYIRDVSRFLLGRGHKVAVYSPALGPLAKELTDSGCLVSDVPDFGDFKPDIIHGQHHIDLMPIALKYFSVPIVYFTHGVRPAEENPPAQFPRVVKHVCVSNLCKNELLKTRDVPADEIEVLFNFVDENVFDFMSAKSTGSMKEANSGFNCLVFGNAKPNEIEALRTACKELNIVLDEGGIWSEIGNVENPASFLPNYDIVFCYGRSAMEALYCGCDVVLMHSTGTGEVVTDSNFLELRERNFGFTTCQTLYGVKGLIRKIIKIMDARIAGKLLLNIDFRKSLRSKPVLERLEEIYTESIHSWKQRKALYTADELQKADNSAMSDYFLELRETMRFK